MAEASTANNHFPLPCGQLGRVYMYGYGRNPSKHPELVFHRHFDVELRFDLATPATTLEPMSIGH